MQKEFGLVEINYHLATPSFRQATQIYQPDLARSFYYIRKPAYMEEKKDMPADNNDSAKAAIERGEKAVQAEQQINKKNADDPKVKAESSKDAEQWRNEG